MIVIVGNKADKVDERVVSFEEGKSYAEDHKYLFAEVSAKSGEGIYSLFNEVIFTEITEKYNIKLDNNEDTMKNLHQCSSSQPGTTLLKEIGKMNKKKKKCC
jgi:50S ribosomal subunit-associated GTPase HflX